MTRPELFKQALKNSDTIKVILTGVGETEFTTKEIYEYISELEKTVKYWFERYREET